MKRMCKSVRWVVRTAEKRMISKIQEEKLQAVATCSLNLESSPCDSLSTNITLHYDFHLFLLFLISFFFLPFFFFLFLCPRLLFCLMQYSTTQSFISFPLFMPLLHILSVKTGFQYSKKRQSKKAKTIQDKKGLPERKILLLLSMPFFILIFKNLFYLPIYCLSLFSAPSPTFLRQAKASTGETKFTIFLCFTSLLPFSILHLFLFSINFSHFFSSLPFPPSTWCYLPHFLLWLKQVSTHPIVHLYGHIHNKFLFKPILQTSLKLSPQFTHCSPKLPSLPLRKHIHRDMLYSRGGGGDRKEFPSC